MPTVWKMPIKSEREDFEKDPSKIQKAREFCFENGWVGIGWELELTAPLSEVDFEKKTETVRGRSALSAFRSFAKRMKIADFVWCRVSGDIYWLGQIQGDWRNELSEIFSQHELHQVRKCKWVKAGPADQTPAAVRNAFAGRGSTISRINKDADETLRATIAIWNKMLPNDAIHLDATKELQKFKLSAFAHDDLEDFVALYLQVQLGWLVIPTTAKKSTPYTEFVMRNLKGERAYVQVKSGFAEIGLIAPFPEEIDKFYIFDSKAPAQTSYEGKMVRLGTQDLAEFAQTNPFFVLSYFRKD